MLFPVLPLSPLPPSPSPPSPHHTSPRYNARRRDPNNYSVPSNQSSTCALYLNSNEAESKGGKIHCALFFLRYSYYGVKPKSVAQIRCTSREQRCFVLQKQIVLQYTAFVRLQRTYSSCIVRLWRISFPCFNFCQSSENTCFGGLINCIIVPVLSEHYFFFF